MKNQITSPERILLVGAGKMGSALLECWLKAGVKPKSIMVCDKEKPESLKLSDIKNPPDCIIIAVKPQSANELLPELKKYFSYTPLYISIMAGKKVEFLEENLGKHAAIIRAMPNTPALIGKAMTAIFANKNVTDNHKNIAKFLFNSAGETVWLKEEAQMDIVTAISGSGPAYMFLILESIIEAGVKNGLSEHTAKKLAIETMIGSAELAKSSSDELSVLRENVTSKGGTTEAALEVLMQGDIAKNLIAQAIDKAIKRAKEL
jgi:pyrroline-5-carboxylate reductase